MNRLINRLATASHTPPALAAEKLQEIVYEVLVKLRSGQPATIPGLGTFVPGAAIRFEVEHHEGKQG